MSHHDLPEPFRPQNLRSYVASYAEIARPACNAATTVTKLTGTNGAITQPEGRRTPKFIAPWSRADLREERAVIDAILYETDREPLSLPEKRHVERVGEELALIDSESALLLFDANTLHAPATRILRQLLASERISTAVAEAAQRAIRQGGAQAPQLKELRPGNITFPTHRNSIPTNRSGTKRKRGDDPHEHGLDDLRSGPADVFSIIEYLPGVNPSPNAGGPSNAPEEAAAGDEEGNWELLFIKEAKAPHKLTATMIDRAVGNPNRILESGVIMGRGRPEPGDDSEEASQFWFAAVCAQLYSSMIQLGLRYGVITTGVRYVFVSIDGDDPSTLRYSISGNTSRVHESPLLRLVSLALRAIQHGRFQKDDSAVRSISGGHGLTWRTANEFPSFSGTEDRGKSPETGSWGPSPDGAGGHYSSGSEGQNHSVCELIRANNTFAQDNSDNIPYLSPPRDNPSVLGKRRRDVEVEGMGRKIHQRLEGSSQAVMPTTPTSSPPSSPAPPPRTPLSKVPYCNTACLRSISSNIDEPPSKETLCPNHAEHERHGRLTGAALRQGIKDLIENPVYDDDRNSQLQYYFLPLSFDTRPVMVKLRFHGYTILGKAFTTEDLSTLHREAHVYRRLRHLQGSCVPVCLGTIELLDRSLCHFGWDFTSLLLLGFGGCSFKSWPYLRLGIAECKGEAADRLFAKELTAEVQKALAQIHETGVLHKDLALRNVLITEASRREGSGSEPEIHLGVRLIDFGLSRTKREYKDRAERRRKRQNMDAWFNGKHEGEVEFAEACEKEMAACPGAMEKWCARYV